MHPKKKPTLDADALYRLLYVHWALDRSVYPDERQRLQVSAAMLMSAFFGCRLCSIFDTRVKLDPPDAKEPRLDHDEAAGAENPEHVGPTAVPAGRGRPSRTKNRGTPPVSDRPGQADGRTAGSARSDTSEQASDDDFKPDDEDSESDGDDSDHDDGDVTDDDCLAGSDTTRSFLYRHIALFITADPAQKMPNKVFMKITQPNTKGQNNNPRV